MRFNKDFITDMRQQLESALNEIEENKKRSAEEFVRQYKSMTQNQNQRNAKLDAYKNSSKKSTKKSGSITYQPTHIEGKADDKRDKDRIASSAPPKDDISQSENKIYMGEISSENTSVYLKGLKFEREDLIKGIIYSEILTPKFKDN